LTLPPRENGGNMHIKQMQVGTAIEMGATMKVKVSARKVLGAKVKTVNDEGGKQRHLHGERSNAELSSAVHGLLAL
jgi:acetamidase/formamidase